MPSTDQRPAVAAVVAAYGPPESLLETVRLLQLQVDHVVVVDDGSPASAGPLFESLSAAGATVIHQDTNRGIAAALNAGVRTAALQAAPDFYLTLDQDSRITGRYVELALKTYGEARASGLEVGYICAASYSGHAVPLQPSQDGFLHAFDPMQSGFLIPHSTLQRIGPFDEGLFIDGVDSEYTMRARSAGLKVLIGIGCDIEHDLGQRRSALIFGRNVVLRGQTLSYNYHSPSRVYYICRNGTALTRRYAFKAPRWTLFRLVEEVKAHALRFAFSPGRGKLLHAAAKGFLDGLNGTTGRIPADLERRLR